MAPREVSVAEKDWPNAEDLVVDELEPSRKTSGGSTGSARTAVRNCARPFGGDREKVGGREEFDSELQDVAKAKTK